MAKFMLYKLWGYKCCKQILCSLFISLGKVCFVLNMVIDHTPLTPPPLKHIYGSLYCNFLKHFFSARNGTYNIKNDFLLKKNIYIACKYAS